MLKLLLKDTVVYGAANAIQKLVPLFVIPIITKGLGPDALRLYDVSFAYAYVFAFIIIMGQDAAVATLFFDDRGGAQKKEWITSGGFGIQLALLIFFSLLLLPLSPFISSILFSGDRELSLWWTKALLILPGYVVFNYALNLLLWRKKKRSYLLLCIGQTVLSLSSVIYFVLIQKGGLPALFYSLTGSTALMALIGLFLERRLMLSRLFNPGGDLVKRLLILGLPFALTSFFHQLLPSVDRYFLLRFGLGEEMAPYILASKLSVFVSFAASAFVLAFTPYSLGRLHQEGAEKEISRLFGWVSMIGFFAVPLLLIFREQMIAIFANPGYNAAAPLMPYFFYGWVFDLFSYFSTLGIYKSQKSYLALYFFATGLLVTIVLNAILVPLMGIEGAAVAFIVAKALLFFISLVWMKRYFTLSIRPSFWAVLLLSVVASFSVYRWPITASIALVLCTLLIAIFAWRRFNLTQLFSKIKGS